MKNAKDLTKELTYKRKNFWKTACADTKKQAMNFASGYKVFLDDCKTERETVVCTIEKIKEKGFCKIFSDQKNKKVYAVANGKIMGIAILGKQAVSDGVNVIGSHIDAPRVDLKQFPLSQDANLDLGMMSTHYYGGIKKYQWMSTPLALHGVLIKADGSRIDICIGEDEDDPVFVMPDLLIHLAAKEQYAKKLGEAIAASHMNVIFNTIPFIDENDAELKEAVKLNALVLLNEKYGICEADFLSAELELVPAGKARDAGMDRSMVLGYGQDDRICAYTSLQALLDLDADKLDKTAVVLLADKEEVGSEGNTGAASIFLYDFIGDLLKYNNEDCSSYNHRKTVIKTQILSADVNAAINPNYPSVHEKQNAAHMGFGVCLTKFTGARGKSGSSDANAEFMAKIVRIFEKEGVNWQIAALGKVDEGGGGTIAKFLAQNGSQVIDCGTALMGMHSLYELCSKADLFSTYKAYKSFFKHA